MQIRSYFIDTTSDIGNTGGFAAFIDWPLICLSLTFATTLLCTLLIVYRIVHLASGISSYGKIVEIVIESSAMYSLTLIVDLALVARNLESAYYADMIMAYMKVRIRCLCFIQSWYWTLYVMAGYGPYPPHRTRRSGLEFEPRQSGNSQFDKGPQFHYEPINGKKAGRHFSGRWRLHDLSGILWEIWHGKCLTLKPCSIDGNYYLSRSGIRVLIFNRYRLRTLIIQNISCSRMEPDWNCIFNLARPVAFLWAQTILTQTTKSIIDVQGTLSRVVRNGMRVVI